MGSSIVATAPAETRFSTAQQQHKAVRQSDDFCTAATNEQIEHIHKSAMSRLITLASRPDRDLRVLTGHLCTIDYLEHVLANRRQRNLFSSQVELPRKPSCSTPSHDVLPSILVTVEQLDDVDESMGISDDATSTCPELTDVSSGSDFDDDHDDDDDDDDGYSCHDDDDDWERLVLTKTVSYHATIPIMSETTGETASVIIAQEA